MSIAPDIPDNEKENIKMKMRMDKVYQEERERARKLSFEGIN